MPITLGDILHRALHRQTVGANTMENKQKPKLLKKVDLIILLSILAIAIIATSHIVVAQYGYQAEGEDAEIYIAYGGLAFQCLPSVSHVIALYTPEGALNSTDNEFYIGGGGGGMFTFVSNENFTLQFLKSVSANIEGDQGNPPRGITADADGLSPEYPVDEGNRVTIYWAPTLEYLFALPIISFWGFIGGSVISAMSLGGAIKKHSLTLLWIAIIAGFAALVFFIIFINL